MSTADTRWTRQDDAAVRFYLAQQPGLTIKPTTRDRLATATAYVAVGLGGLLSLGIVVGIIAGLAWIARVVR